jgi:hypothetical protein
MGDISDVLRDVDAKNPERLVPLDIAEATVSTISNIAGGITGVFAVIDLVKGAFEGDKLGKLQRGVDQLLEDYQKLFELIGAAEELKRNRDIADQLGASRAQLLPILESPPGSANFEASRGNMLNFTAIPLETIVQEAYWRRPFLAAAVYNDAWAGDLPPPKEGKSVFDYLMVLPAFLEALCNRICVLAVLFEDFPNAGVRRELGNWAQALEKYYSRTSDGIVTERPPDLTELLYNFNFPDPTGIRPPIEPSFWDKSGRTFGSIQVYSGLASVGRYPDRRFPNVLNPDGSINFQVFPEVIPSVGFETALHGFRAKHAIATTARWKRLYSDIGLPAAWRMIVDLKKLSGTPATNTFDSGSSWSIREVNRLVRRNLGGEFSEKDMISGEQLFELLDAQKPISIRSVLEVDAS